MERTDKSIHRINPKDYEVIGSTLLRCYDRETIDIPTGITGIRDGAFLGCYNLSCIIVEKQNPCFADIDGILFEKIENKIICYPAGKKNVRYVIPAGVTAIGDYAFACNEIITDIDIPASVTDIGELTFSGCENLKMVYLSRETPISESELENISVKFIYRD